MEIHKYLLGILAFSLVIFVGLNAFTNMVTNYDISTNATNEFNSTYKMLNETYQLSQNMKEDVTGGEVEGGEQSWESMVRGGYSAVRLIGNSFILVGSVLSDIMGVIGLPEEFHVFAMTAIVILVIFSIIYMVFRFKG